MESILLPQTLELMPAPRKSPQPPAFLIPPEILLSLATGPLLLGIIGSKAISSFLREMGQSSEEMFRGDRLPLLNLDDGQQPVDSEQLG